LFGISSICCAAQPSTQPTPQSTIDHCGNITSVIPEVGPIDHERRKSSIADPVTTAELRRR
jgi:hypothetical protein